jgi:hypothetical protein
MSPDQKSMDHGEIRYTRYCFLGPLYVILPSRHIGSLAERRFAARERHAAFRHMYVQLRNGKLGRRAHSPASVISEAWNGVPYPYTMRIP